MPRFCLVHEDRLVGRHGAGVSAAMEAGRMRTRHSAMLNGIGYLWSWTPTARLLTQRPVAMANGRGPARSTQHHEIARR
eukprot:5905607-Pleurochrysis_carterae.AAC.2